ncbi:carbohydrate ABC transporter permease [Eubacteriales bacterium OttesenSCG-928-N13]|nr:carbohydrate ABC transporter permease [Eubacteriales bacterium OttesenSCG-928-N13]
MSKATAYYEKKSKRERRANLATYIVLIFMVLIINIPFLQMIMTSFKTRAEAMSSTNFFPSRLSFENFEMVLMRTNFSTNIINSFIVSIVVTVACIMFSVMAGYAISRFKGRVFNAYTTFMLVLQLFPGVLMLIPLFVIMRNLNLIDKLPSVMLAYTATNLPFSIWLLKGFFNSIPFDIEQAGMIDGCSQFGTFWRLVLPISMPGVSTVAIFTFINAWCEFTVASILLRSDGVMTITVGLQKFVQQYTQDWPALMAASTLSSLPTLIFLMIAQKYLVQGMGAGSVKG